MAWENRGQSLAEQQPNLAAHQQRQSKFAATITRSMVHTLKTFNCRLPLGARMHPDTIGCVRRGEFDLNALLVDRETFDSGI